MNPRLASLQPYPFERLRSLLAGIEPPDRPLVDFSIGEPRQSAPGFISETIIEQLHGLTEYPKVAGDPRLREAMIRWAESRFSLPADFLDPERNVLPANGSREALFSIAQVVLDPCGKRKNLVLMPNPFYQIYEGAALLAGGEPYYLNCGPHGQPDFFRVPEGVWERCALLYINSPHNPTGAVLPLETLEYLLVLARKWNFVVASDECYSEIYFSSPPPGILSAAARTGSLDQALAFQSLSKRSSIPGARSGFVAGDGALLASFLRYRTYLGAATPPFLQAAAREAWGDERHVVRTRALYAEKFGQAEEILGDLVPIVIPDGGFYLWLEVADGEQFARSLYASEHVRCLPGAYLARMAHGAHPGQDRVRIALVNDMETCREGLLRIRNFLETPSSTAPARR